MLTGITNAAAESLNRLAKLEARQAYGFRTPRNRQRRAASPAPGDAAAGHAPKLTPGHER